MPVDLPTLIADVQHVRATWRIETETRDVPPLDLREAALVERLRFVPRTWSAGPVSSGRMWGVQVSGPGVLLGHLLVEHSMLSSLTGSTFDAWKTFRRRYSPVLSEPALAWNLMVHPSVQGAGLGRTMLAVGASIAAEEWNAPFTGGVAIGLVTSPDARRAWTSLAALLPHATTGPSPLQPELPGIPILWGGPLL